MAFKPRIFISSTFSDNKKVRDSIKKHFIELGAEPLLYESNLTPSTKPMTYRKDILEADFVILIMKDNYGTETDWGISGTHEEYRIAKENRIPIHVYLKPSKSQDNKLIKELLADQVSFYYFKTDVELMNRLKETTFIIAEEIILKNLEQKRLSHLKVCQLSYNSDYQRAMDIIRSVEHMKKYSTQFGFDYLTTNIFTSFMEPIIDYFNHQEHIFINWKLDDALENVVLIANKFISNHVLDYTTIPNTFTELTHETFTEVLVSRVSYYQNTDLNNEDYQKMLKDFFEKYEEFKNIVKELRFLADIN